MDDSKSFFSMKAEDLTKRKLGQWLAGDIGRRLMVVPFTGDLPGGKAGLDLDGEYFDAETDLYGPYPALRATRWREMDWHHDDFKVPPKQQGGPALSMKGMIIGEIELDEDPDEFGHWADWWIKRGKANEQLIGARRVAALEQLGQPLWGSSQAIFKQKAADGHIEVWPLYRHTASTSPRNTHAVIPALKAMLADLHTDDLSVDAMTALVVGLGALLPELRTSFPELDGASSPVVGGEGAAKAGRVLSAANEAALRRAVDELSEVLSKL
ncbi:MAG: hypothetical protein ACREIB_01295, partial [Pseudomonadota bacterium]